MSRRSMKTTIAIFLVLIFSAASAHCQSDDSGREILKQGLLGAGTGAIASGASGGNAGKGALIGAGTGVIGGILLDAITSPPRSSRRVSQPPPQDDYYYDDQQQEVYYEEPPQESTSQKVLKQGLLGAGTGAIAAGTTGGKAGEGALIGAGTGIVGGALLDMLTKPAPQSTGRVYRQPRSQPQQYQQPYQQQYQAQPQYQAQVPSQNIQVQDEVAGSEGGKKRIIKKYDPTGKLISEEEVYY